MKLNNVDRSRLARAAAKLLIPDQGISWEDALLQVQGECLSEEKLKTSYADELKGLHSRMNYYLRRHINMRAKKMYGPVPTEPHWGPLEEGKYYVRRDGKTCGPAKLNEKRKYRPWNVWPGTYWPNGKIRQDHIPHKLDLVGEGKEEDAIKRRKMPDWLAKRWFKKD